MAHLQISRAIPAGRFEVYDYLSDPQSLPLLLAPTIDVEVLSPEVPLKRGSEFHFMMTRLSLSQSVRLRIEDVLRGSRLTYRQSEGLFSLWNHTTKFEERGENMTFVTDIVDYSMPFGWMGYLLDDLVVKKDMSTLLENRLKKAEEHFASS